MSEKRQDQDNIIVTLYKYALKARDKVLSVCSMLNMTKIWQKIKLIIEQIKNCNIRTVTLLLKKIYKKIKSWLRKCIKFGKKFFKKASASWRILLFCIPTFLFCYYGLGGLLAEQIDVTTEYKLRDKRIPTFETAFGMSFLLKREVDDKMWTPNLPPIFPAYVLDNMPNFQVGIVHAVKDIASVIRRFEQNTEKQKQDIQKTCEFLSYPPTIWLMNKKDGFNLAPSSTAQYRKAAAELQKFGKDGVFYPHNKDLEMLLYKIGQSLQKMAIKNESHQTEHHSDWADTKVDDLFYYTKGYAFAMWQITKVLGTDYHDVLLFGNTYTEWTYLVNSLKNAATFNPRIVRNASPESVTAPNHLMIQNYYLLRALTAAEKVRNKLLRAEYADKN